MLELKSNPESEDSTTFKITAFILRDHMPVEEYLMWRVQLRTIIKQLPIKAVEDKIAMARQLIQGDRLVAFESALGVLQTTRLMDKTTPSKSKKTDKAKRAATDKEKRSADKKDATEGSDEDDSEKATRGGPKYTERDFENLLKTLSHHVFPLRALRYQSRYMKYKLRKPREVKTRAFVARVQQMNAYLEFFPPFQANQVLNNEALLEVLEVGVPNAWRKEFVRTGYDPVDHDVDTFIQRCERVEFNEELEDAKSAKPKTPTNGPSANTETKSSGKPGAKSHAKSSAEGKSKSKNASVKNSTKFCDLHQCHGHSTSECKVVQGQITKMRDMWKNTSAEAKFNNKQKDKKRGQDLHSLVQEAVASALKKSGKRTKGQYNETNVLDQVDQPQYYSDSSGESSAN